MWLSMVHNVDDDDPGDEDIDNEIEFSRLEMWEAEISWGSRGLRP